MTATICHSDSTELVKLDKKRTHQVYKTSDGKRVPGGSTIAKLACGSQSQGALMHWAWKCGCEGNDYRKVSGEACDIGTLAHFLCECHVKGQKPDLSEFSREQIDKAENAFIKFLSWWDTRGMTLLGSEVQLVSDAHRYGGTLDIVATDSDGVCWLVDLKTSKSIYPEMWVQLAGYRDLWDTWHPQKTIDKVAIVRIGKECDVDDFEVVERQGTANEFDVFLIACNLYHALKGLKK